LFCGTVNRSAIQTAILATCEQPWRHFRCRATLTAMTSSLLRFGACTVDTAARELRCDDALVTLSPKVFDTLAYLLAHRERAVGRDELIAAVWGRADVTDTLLGQTVLKVRRAIGDGGDDKGAIRTIPRFGYRWVAPVTEVEPPRESAAAAVEIKTEKTPAKPTRSAVFAAALLALFCAIGVVVSMLRPKAPLGTVQSPASALSVAVLPVNVMASGEWDWLRLGLMDLVASRLRRGGQAVVPSDNVVALSRGAGAQSNVNQALRDATGARYVAQTSASFVDAKWTVSILLHGIEQADREVSAQAGDPIDAARAACDRLLFVLGKSPPPDSDNATLSLTEVQQRSEAALLGNDVNTARRLIESAPQALRDSPLLRLQLAQVDFRAGHLQPARQNLETLLAQTPADADTLLRARALFTLGAVAVREDRSEDAVRAFDEAIAIASRRNESGVLGRAYTGRAAAMVNLGRHDDAAADLGRARVALALAGDNLGLARVDANEGVLDNARGRPAEALAVLQRAAEHFRRFGALNELFLTAAAQIKACLGLLDPASALSLSDAVWQQRAQLDNPRSLGALGVQRARALVAVGKGKEATQLLDELDPAVSSDQKTGLAGDVASTRALLRLTAGDAPGAIDAAHAAVDRLTTLDEAPERSRAWLTLTRALRSAAREGEARGELAKFLVWQQRDAKSPPMSLFARLAQGEADQAARHFDQATQAYADAFAEAERWAVPADLVTVAVPYANALIDRGDSERAGAVVGRLGRWAEQDFDCALLQARLYHALGRAEPWRDALAHARAVAGERAIPADLATPPAGSK
jgi:DNA-binding winged helix-turn-helix (wHTH) protein/tetratricopeptide (TPR) repeat protein